VFNILQQICQLNHVFHRLCKVHVADTLAVGNFITCVMLLMD